MTVMVTGGCGLGGSFAVRYALDQGEDVVAFDIAIRTDLLNDVKDRVRFVKGDISNASEVFAAVADHGVRRILHTASFLTGPAYDRPLAAAQTMVIGTLNVLEAARALKVERVVHVSTGKTVPTARQFAEAAGSGNVKIMPDPYTSHKVATELLCNDYRGLYGMDIVVIYPGQLFGPGYDFAGGFGRALKPIVEKSLRGESVVLDAWDAAAVSTPRELNPTPPIRTVPVMYASDAGRGEMMATLAGDLPANVYRLQSKEELTMYEITQIIMRLIPGSSIEAPEPEVRGGPVDPDSPANRDFGFAPEYDMEAGLREYVNFLQTGRYRRLLGT